MEQIPIEQFNLRTPTIKDKIKANWLKQIMEENPDINCYMADILIETYLLDPQKTEEILKKYS
jgi:hypothetical protein